MAIAKKNANSDETLDFVRSAIKYDGRSESQLSLAVCRRLKIPPNRSLLNRILNLKNNRAMKTVEREALALETGYYGPPAAGSAKPLKHIDAKRLLAEIAETISKHQTPD